MRESAGILFFGAFLTHYRKKKNDFSTFFAFSRLFLASSLLTDTYGFKIHESTSLPLRPSKFYMAMGIVSAHLKKCPPANLNACKRMPQNDSASKAEVAAEMTKTVERGRTLDRFQTRGSMSLRRSYPIVPEDKFMTELLNKREAANQLRISERTLDRQRDQGLIKHVQIGSQVFFRPEFIEEYLNRQTMGGLKGGKNWHQ
jgi:helix-turn-helix protein